MFETIIFEKNEGKASIVLNRPKVYNALNEQLLLELQDAFKQCENDKTLRVVTLSGGSSPAFCSGADLKAGLTEFNLGKTLEKNYNPLILSMRNLKVPIICKLNGIAAGAGLSIALACDLIIAEENAYMSELFVGIGLIPDAGSMYFLPRMVGYQKAFEMCSTGRKVYMKEAQEIGLVAKVVPAAELDATVESLEQLFAASATKSIGEMKAILNKSYQSSLEEVLALEAEGQTKCGFSEDFAEGAMAFIQKRTPVFKGK